MDVDADANREDDLADPLLADGEEKQEEKPAERPRKTLKNMTRYERARILGTRALQIRKVLILLKYLFKYYFGFNLIFLNKIYPGFTKSA